MYFQKVLKGISGLTMPDVRQIVQAEGIRCNWWRKMGAITTDQIKHQLTEPNVLYHLNHYNTPLPAGHPYASLPGAATYGDVTPFISTTAGAIQRSGPAAMNIHFPAFMTAQQFATRNFTVTGHIFYAYLITLGKKAVPLWQFSEEVRELHVYRQFLPYHQEGEIMAKIVIPSPQIEKAEEYDGPLALQDLQNDQIPVPVTILNNPSYTQPDQYSNIREII